MNDLFWESVRKQHNAPPTIMTSNKENVTAVVDLTASDNDTSPAKKPRIENKEEKERKESLLKRRQELKAKVSELQAEEAKECKNLTSRHEKDMNALLEKHKEEEEKLEESQYEETMQTQSKRAPSLDRKSVV